MSFEEHQFSELIKQHQSRLRGYISSLGVNYMHVDDIAQETFLLAYRKQAEFDKQKDFGYWLNGIARNLIRNELNKQARHARIMNEKLSYYLINELEKEPEDPLKDITDINALNSCISSLPNSSRELIRKRYADETDTGEIALQFNIPAANVRQKLFRLRDKLKKCVSIRVKNNDGK